MTTQEALQEAENRLAASLHAMRTHGYQGITYAALKADAILVDKLRKIAAGQDPRSV
jgi:hypothetical protein